MKVSIHQPTYLPWIGFFHKMVNCDKFVFFDDVQLSNGKTFETRTQIKTSNGLLELVIPVQREENVLIKDVKIASGNWRDKHMKSIRLAYSNAPHFDKYINDLEVIYSRDWVSLVDFNLELIKLMMWFIGIDTDIILSSSIPSRKKGGERIIEIVKELGGDEYLSGSGEGSKRYVNEDDFKKEGIKLIWQDFKDPIYPQLYGEFIPKMSIIDLLFNVSAKEILKTLTGHKGLTNKQINQLVILGPKTCDFFEATVSELKNTTNERIQNKEN